MKNIFSIFCLCLFLFGCQWFPLFGATQQSKTQQSLDDLREPYGKYKGWICIYPAPSAVGDKCVAQVMSCKYAFENCKGMRVLKNYQTGIITFYIPQPELSFEDWSKCWKEMQDIALKGYK